MNLVSFQAFSLLVLVGLLIFFSSFISLDFHLSIDSKQRHKKGAFDHFFHFRGAPRSAVRRSSTGGAESIKFLENGISHNEVLEIDAEKILREGKDMEASEERKQQLLKKLRAAESTRTAQLREQERLADREQQLEAAALEAENTSSSINAKGSGGIDSNDSNCILYFPPKCRINPIVKYWDEVTECYSSPLRHFVGRQAPVEERKFVVFQSDLGGWNNIRMALEVVVLIAQVTGRILVLPPNAILYLLHFNKKWKNNKSSVSDYFDFDRLRHGDGLETMSMKGFLTTIAAPGLLKEPLPDGNTDLVQGPLWKYLEKACTTLLWSPGKQYLGFNITSVSSNYTTFIKDQLLHGRGVRDFIGNFGNVDPARTKQFSLGGKRVLLPYNSTMHSARALYFPGHESNRLLTHFYSFLFFATPYEERRAKRYIRDRLRYHDSIFCTGSALVEKLINLERIPIQYLRRESGEVGMPIPDDLSFDSIKTLENQQNVLPWNIRTIEGALQKEQEILTGNMTSNEYGRDGSVSPRYVAFHIRRGDFQQKFTRLPAERIIELTNHLISDRKSRILYIATDERNRSFFEPFEREYGKIYFLDDLKTGTDVDITNQNYLGMIEQVVCASAHKFVGTPLSTFTAYITRMRGYMNRTLTTHQIGGDYNARGSWRNADGTEKSSTAVVRLPGAKKNRAGIYERTFYFMQHHMHQLHDKPYMHYPLWVRDFVDPFQYIDDDTSTAVHAHAFPPPKSHKH